MPSDFLNLGQQRHEATQTASRIMRPSQDSVSTTTHVDVEHTTINEASSSTSYHHQMLPSIINLGNNRLGTSNESQLPQSPPISFQNLVSNDMNYASPNNHQVAPTTTEQQLTSHSSRILINHRINHDDIAALATQHPNFFRSHQINRVMLPPIGTGSGIELGYHHQHHQHNQNQSSSDTNHVAKTHLKILQNDLIKPPNTTTQVLSDTPESTTTTSSSQMQSNTSQLPSFTLSNHHHNQQMHLPPLIGQNHSNSNNNSNSNNSSISEKKPCSPSNNFDNVLNNGDTMFLDAEMLGSAFIDGDTDTTSDADLTTLASGSGNGTRANETNEYMVLHDSNTDSSNLHTLQNIRADSMSSLDSSLELEKCDTDKDGYQDNTSSHSQQSGGGGSANGSGNGLNSSNGSTNNSGGGGTNSGGGNTGGPGGNNTSINGMITGNSNSGYISLIPPSVGPTGNTNQNGENLDFKHLFEELCPVCGDKVSGYHYGLLTCESCKGFFKRTVQNKKVYTCVAERQCHIDKTQRKRCPYCRFQKCLEVGMKLEAVRADRMRGGRNKFGPMYKRDRARKLQMMRQRQLALQAIRTTIGSADIKPGQLSPTGYQPSYSSMNIKQEIQIPQVSSLTQSPDSSPSPIAIALGQVNPNAISVIPTSLSGAGGGGSGLGSTNNTTTNVVGSAGGANCEHDSTSGSLQHTSNSKLCYDSNTNPSSTADSVSTVEPLRVSPMIREFVQSIDDREWQSQLFELLQKQSYNQVEVDLFELMCKVLDQNLFSQVDWARNTVFFKDLKVDDQMKLLQHSWSDMLVLDHLHQRIHNGLQDETQLHNGQIFNLLNLGLLGVPQLADYFNELQKKLQELKFDMGDYVCMKFLILLNPNVRGIQNKKTVLEGHENVQAALLDYTLTCYPSVEEKFRRLLNILPEIHAMAERGEEHLYHKHCAGSAPTQTLLMEMLHAKRKV